VLNKILPWLYHFKLGLNLAFKPFYVGLHWNSEPQGRVRLLQSDDSMIGKLNASLKSFVKKVAPYEHLLFVSQHLILSFNCSY
jgi:hypothetical protein